MYKCSQCKTPISTDISTVGIQCDKCSSKIFFKDRPNVKKEIRAR